MSIMRPSSPGVVCICTVSLDLVSAHVMFGVYSGCFVCSSENGKYNDDYISRDICVIPKSLIISMNAHQ